MDFCMTARKWWKTTIFRRLWEFVWFCNKFCLNFDSGDKKFLLEKNLWVWCETKKAVTRVAANQDFYQLQCVYCCPEPPHELNVIRRNASEFCCQDLVVPLMDHVFHCRLQVGGTYRVAFQIPSTAYSKHPRGTPWPFLFGCRRMNHQFILSFFSNSHKKQSAEKSWKFSVPRCLKLFFQIFMFFCFFYRPWQVFRRKNSFSSLTTNFRILPWKILLMAAVCNKKCCFGRKASFYLCFEKKSSSASCLCSRCSSSPLLISCTRRLYLISGG